MNIARNSYTWDRKTTEPALTTALEVLSARYPALAGTGRAATALRFRKGEDGRSASVSREDGGIVITYGSLPMALRMVGSVLSGLFPDAPEGSPFKTLGVMLDASRNAAMTVDYLKRWLDRLAILGYNMFMLYTEDLYRLDDEPLFGFMRGAYTREEIREIDRYAASLGIEMIPCIQALAHLEQIFRWDRFEEVHDCQGALLVDEPKTYGLIDRMLSFWAGAVRSRRIHLGMDEAVGLGTGRYAELHGKRSPFEIINVHLKKVCALCGKHGFRPMIWSDMYFCIGSKTGEYYDLDSHTPDEVVRGIPEGLRLVYWDYFHDDEGFYRRFVEKHRALAADPVMGSAVWTWNKFWYDHARTRHAVGPCLRACREAGVGDVFFTMWNDDGGVCDYDSAFTGLAYAAELAFTGEADPASLEKRLRALFRGASYRANCALGELMPGFSQWFLFDDPIMLLYAKSELNRDGREVVAGKTYRFETMGEGFKRVRGILAKTRPRGDAGDIRFARAFVDAVVAKWDWMEAAIAAGEAGDMRPALRAALPLARRYLRAIRSFEKVFRAMWFSHNKTFGFETVQVRFAGQVARTRELVRRLESFVEGPEARFPELAELARGGAAVRVGQYPKYPRIAGATTIF